MKLMMFASMALLFDSCSEPQSSSSVTYPYREFTPYPEKWSTSDGHYRARICHGQDVFIATVTKREVLPKRPPFRGIWSLLTLEKHIQMRGDAPQTLATKGGIVGNVYQLPSPHGGIHFNVGEPLMFILFPKLGQDHIPVEHRRTRVVGVRLLASEWPSDGSASQALEQWCAGDVEAFDGITTAVLFGSM